MRHLLFSFAVVMIVFSTGLSQHRKTIITGGAKSAAKAGQKSVVRDQDLETLTASSDGTIFVGGYLFTIVDDHYVNYGLLWKIKDSKVTLQRAPVFPRYSFWLDDQTGWIVGTGEGVYKTTDGGLSWAKQSYSDEIRENVFFLDKDHGWYFADDDDDVLKQVDGEETRAICVFDNFPYRNKLQFVTPQVGWLSDEVDRHPRFQKSEDGGKTWDLIQAPLNDVNDFQFINTGDGYVATPKGLYSTLDGGHSWDLVLKDEQSGWIDKIYFLSTAVGWTFGKRICMTQNAGRDWSCKEKPTILKGDPVKSFVFTNENDGWLLIDNKLFFTTDGGRRWKRKILKFGNYSF